MAKKKKQDKNPRVKHRKKYTKAVIKRKSQVRVTRVARVAVLHSPLNSGVLGLVHGLNISCE